MLKIPRTVSFVLLRVICAAFLIYAFQLNGVAAKFRIWPDIRISQGDKGAFCFSHFYRTVGERNLRY